MIYIKTLTILVSVVFLLGLTKIQGDPIRVSWVAPTEYTDNTPLPATDLSHYTVKWNCDASGDGSIVVPAPGTSVMLDDSLLGNCVIVVSVTTVNDSVSADSPSVGVFIKLPKPSYGGFR